MLAATSSVLASPTLWVSTFVGLSVCFSRARIFRSRTGRDPWGIPLWAWVLLGFLFGLISALVVLIATRTSAMTRTTRSMPARGGYSYSPSPVTAPPVSTAQSTKTRPAGWHPVPGVPDEQMFWDGTAWISHVRWDGTSWVGVQGS